MKDSNRFLLKTSTTVLITASWYVPSRNHTTSRSPSPPRALRGECSPHSLQPSRRDCWQSYLNRAHSTTMPAPPPPATPQDPLLAHPLAARTADTEPTLRVAYAPPEAPPSHGVRTVEREPDPTPAPPIWESESSFVARRARTAPPPRVIGAGNVRDPLSQAARARVPHVAPPPAGRAYASGEPVTRLRPLLTEPKAEAAMSGVHVRVLLRDGASPGVFTVSTRSDCVTDGGCAMPVPDSPTSPIPANPEFCYGEVARGVADFAWLHGRLQARYDGVIVPHLPAMALRGRLIYGFAYEAERVRGLERFLRQLVAHPVLSGVEETRAFLGIVGEDAWRMARKKPLSNENKLSNWLLSPGTSAHGRTDAGGRTRASAEADADEGPGPVEQLTRWSTFKLWQAGRRLNKNIVWFLNRDTQDVEPATEEEKQLERLQRYVKELQESLRETKKCMRGVEASRRQSYCTHLAFQNSLHELGEREGGLFGTFLRSIAIVQAQEQREQQSHDNVQTENGGSDVDAPTAESARQHRGSDAESAAFDSVLHPRSIASRTPEKLLEEALVDYETRAAGAQRLVQQRCYEREAYEHAVDVYAKLRNKWESQTSSIWDSAAASPQPASFPATGGRLYAEICAAADALAAAQRQYQIADRSTNDELRRLRKEMHHELCDALRAVATEAADQHRRYALAWENLASRVDVFRSVDAGPDGAALFGAGAPAGSFPKGVATAGG